MIFKNSVVVDLMGAEKSIFSKTGVKPRFQTIHFCRVGHSDLHFCTKTGYVVSGEKNSETQICVNISHETKQHRK